MSLEEQEAYFEARRALIGEDPSPMIAPRPEHLTTVKELGSKFGTHGQPKQPRVVIIAPVDIELMTREAYRTQSARAGIPETGDWNSVKPEHVEQIPAGTKLWVFKKTTKGPQKEPAYFIQHGNEQFGISEADLKGYAKVRVKSLLYPREFSYLRVDGPKGEFTGYPTGEENIQSENPKAEREFVRLLNMERAKHGLTPLKWSEDLARVARYTAATHAVHDTSGYQSHVTFRMNGFAPQSGDASQNLDNWNFINLKPLEDAPARMARFGRGRGEIKTSFPSAGSPEKAIRNFLNSPPHRALILSSEPTLVGCGAYSNQSSWVATLQ